MAWSWVRGSYGTSAKVRDCMGDDRSARKFDECVRSIVQTRNGRVDDVLFEANGKRARVRFWWENHDDKLAIVLDLEADDVQDVFSADEMDDRRSR